jgi:dipeptidyl aminopeptidase/acylaminoacyl peptidase
MGKQLQYQLPHENILTLADTKLAPVIKLDRHGKCAVFLHRNIYKQIEELAIEECRLAGMITNPLNNISPRESYYYNFTIIFLDDNQQEYSIAGLPENCKLCRVTFNYANDKIAFLNITESNLELWYFDIYERIAYKIANNINANLSSPYSWLKDNTMLVNNIRNNHSTIKLNKDEVTSSVIIEESHGLASENRTYQDLLKNKIDEYNFELLVTSEISQIGLDGSKSLWKSAAMHDGFSVSPDGLFVMLSEIKKPFSYTLLVDRFPCSTYIYSIAGQLIKTVVETPLIDHLPQGFMATQQGMRSLRWRSDKPNTIVWVEALDEGNPEIKVDYRDAIFEQSFPFTEDPILLYKTKDRFAGISFAKHDLALVYERWWNTRNQRMVFINPEKGEVLFVYNERNFQDIYSDPGNFISSENEFSWSSLIAEEDGTMYINGEGVSAEGRQNFIDKYNYKTQIKERIFTVNNDQLQEDISHIIDIKKGEIITVKQSKTVYPNFYKTNIYSKTNTVIRHYENPFKAIDSIHKEFISYKRADGVVLNAVMYLPVGVTKETAKDLPMLMYAYPTEFKDKNTASQRNNSDHDFVYPFWGSMLYWVNRGFVVLDDVSFPILGEGDDQPNDTYVDQLCSNAKAAIDYVDSLGYINRKKVAIGGHSYGAFMVAMLLTHTDYFAAGIARSGAYNRTLTPFGFQSEERNYWQAKDVYNAMNPFMDADKMKTPLLLIHGQKDNNPGTFTMQSERYFAALKSQGATARLVILPHESHSYSAKESILHVLWEQDQWLTNWVVNDVI